MDDSYQDEDDPSTLELEDDLWSDDDAPSFAPVGSPSFAGGEPDEEEPEEHDADSSQGASSEESVFEKLKEFAKEQKSFVALLGVAILGLVGLTVKSCAFDGGSDAPPAKQAKPSAIAKVDVAPAATATSSTTSQTSAPQASGAKASNPIPISSARSSCNSPQGGPDLAVDGKTDTAWVCERKFNKDGQVLELALSGKYIVTSVCVVPGYNKQSDDGTDEWNRHRTLSILLYVFDGGRQVEQNTENKRDIDCVQIPGIPTQNITVVVKHTSQPDGATTDLGAGGSSDFALSDIQVMGYPM